MEIDRKRRRKKTLASTLLPLRCAFYPSIYLSVCLSILESVLLVSVHVRRPLLLVSVHVRRPRHPATLCSSIYLSTFVYVLPSRQPATLCVASCQGLRTCVWRDVKVCVRVQILEYVWRAVKVCVPVCGGLCVAGYVWRAAKVCVQILEYVWRAVVRRPWHPATHTHTHTQVRELDSTEELDDLVAAARATPLVLMFHASWFFFPVFV